VRCWKNAGAKIEKRPSNESRENENSKAEKLKMGHFGFLRVKNQPHYTRMRRRAIQPRMYLARYIRV